jgi:hypothetical protein
MRLGALSLACPAWVTPRFRLHVLAWAALSLLAYGLVAAIIPNPVFGRSVPPEPFAIAIWLVSAPLMGFLGATYSAPPAVATQPLQMVTPGPATGPSRPPADDSRATLLGSVAGFGTFLAIGCPVCNKIALLLLGASGAMSVWAPIQPILGAASLALLAGTVAWRSRQLSSGAACAV